MCNEFLRLQSFISAWTGQSIKELFSRIQINPIFKYNNVYPGHCLICKKSLSRQQMWPNGRCPRSMCESCYNNIIIGTTNQRCIVSGVHLPDHKIKLQRINPREVENNVADGYARDYYSLVACKALGINLSFLNDESYNFPDGYIPDLYVNDKDTIDAEYHVLPKQFQPPTPALPYLQDRLKVPNLFNVHNQKRVKVIAK